MTHRNTSVTDFAFPFRSVRYVLCDKWSSHSRCPTFALAKAHNKAPKFPETKLELQIITIYILFTSIYNCPSWKNTKDMFKIRWDGVRGFVATMHCPLGSTLAAKCRRHSSYLCGLCGLCGPIYRGKRPVTRSRLPKHLSQHDPESLVTQIYLACVHILDQFESYWSQVSIDSGFTYSNSRSCCLLGVKRCRYEKDTFC